MRPAMIVLSVALLGVAVGCERGGTRRAQPSSAAPEPGAPSEPVGGVGEVPSSTTSQPQVPSTGGTGGGPLAPASDAGSASISAEGARSLPAPPPADEDESSMPEP